MHAYEFTLDNDKIARIAGRVVTIIPKVDDIDHALDGLIYTLQTAWKSGRGHGPFPLSSEIREASHLRAIIDREPQQPLAF